MTVAMLVVNTLKSAERASSDGGGSAGWGCKPLELNILEKVPR